MQELSDDQPKDIAALTDLRDEGIDDPDILLFERFRRARFAAGSIAPCYLFDGRGACLSLDLRHTPGCSAQ